MLDTFDRLTGPVLLLLLSAAFSYSLLSGVWQAAVAFTLIGALLAWRVSGFLRGDTFPTAVVTTGGYLVWGFLVALQIAAHHDVALPSIAAGVLMTVTVSLIGTRDGAMFNMARHAAAYAVVVVLTAILVFGNPRAGFYPVLACLAALGWSLLLRGLTTAWLLVEHAPADKPVDPHLLSISRRVWWRGATSHTAIMTLCAFIALDAWLPAAYRHLPVLRDLLK